MRSKGIAETVDSEELRLVSLFAAHHSRRTLSFHPTDRPIPLTPAAVPYIFPAPMLPAASRPHLKGKLMSTIVTLIALLIALSSTTPETGSRINPVQHSERTTAQAGKGINPVQHSE
jgi:hypothetical protein